MHCSYCRPLRSSSVLLFLVPLRPPSSTLFPYTTLFRSLRTHPDARRPRQRFVHPEDAEDQLARALAYHERLFGRRPVGLRSEEHTSELQSHSDLVCRLLLEKKKKYKIN